MLVKKPMSGVEIVEVVENETGGRWIPSSGSIYPLLAQLYNRGYTTEKPSEETGLKRYALTAKGKAFFEKQLSFGQKLLDKLEFIVPILIGGFQFAPNDKKILSGTMRARIIAVRGLTKNYILGKTTVYALRGVNLDIKEGEFISIVGNSGAGKTTLLNCMAGLDSPDYGVVLFRGENLHKMDDSTKSKVRLSEMGFIFQSYALLPHFNARENISLPADLAGLSKDLKERIDGLLEGVGLSGQAKQYPATLSGGQMQRVAIARALTNRPAVIFADEPTGDLDSKTGRQVMDLLKKFHEETKTTIIVITHEQDIADYAERQVTLEDGIIA